MFKANPKRTSQMSIEWEDFFVDFSKNKWTFRTLKIFKSLAKEIDLKAQIESYFRDNNVNFTENRAVLHTALRSSEEEIICEAVILCADRPK